MAQENRFGVRQVQCSAMVHDKSLSNDLEVSMKAFQKMRNYRF